MARLATPTVPRTPLRVDMTFLTPRRLAGTALGVAAGCLWAVGAFAAVPLDLSDPLVSPGTELKNIDDTSTNRWGVSLGNYITGIQSGAVMPNFVTDFTLDKQGNAYVASIDGQVNLIDASGQLKSTLILNLPDHSDLNDALDWGFTAVELHPDFYHVGTAGYGKLYTVESGIDGDLKNQPEPADTGSEVGSADQWFRDWSDFDSEYQGYFQIQSREHHRSVVNEYTFDPTNLDAGYTAVREVLSTHQEQHGHNLGDLLFDPTAQPGDDDYGLLYISSADGGNGSGFERNSSSTDNIYGAILRIDPIVPTDEFGNPVDTATRQVYYGVDPDEREFNVSPDPHALAKFSVPIGISANPFADNDGTIEANDLIVTTGLRNPYRISIDTLTGEMWSSDTGQLNIETVDKLTWGGDHGWGLLEGDFFYLQNAKDQTNAPTWIGGLTESELQALEVTRSDNIVSGNRFSLDNNTPRSYSLTQAEIDRILNATRPEFQYDHTDGASSIGGFVYRGEALPELYGMVLFAEFQGKVDPDAVGDPDPDRDFDRLGGRLLYGDPSLDPGDEGYGQIYEFIIDPNGDGLPFRLLGLSVDVNGEPIIYGVDFDEFGNPIGAVLTVSPVLGDTNIDGKLTQEDVLSFVAGLIDRDAYINDYNVRPELRADFNGDGLFNFDDILPFADALNIDSQAIFALVPEPTALLSMTLLAPLVISRRRKTHRN